MSIWPPGGCSAKFPVPFDVLEAKGIACVLGPTLIRGVPIDSAVGLFGDSGRFASGMAARKGEDPLAGLQRSLQPGPQGDAHFLRSQRRTTPYSFGDRALRTLAFITGINILNR